MKIEIKTNKLSYPGEKQTAIIEDVVCLDVASGDKADYIAISNGSKEGTLYFDRSGIEDLQAALEVIKTRLKA